MKLTCAKSVLSNTEGNWNTNGHLRRLVKPKGEDPRRLSYSPTASADLSVSSGHFPSQYNSDLILVQVTQKWWTPRCSPSWRVGAAAVNQKMSTYSRGVAGAYVTKHAAAVSVSTFWQWVCDALLLEHPWGCETKINSRSHYCNWKSNRREVAVAKEKKKKEVLFKTPWKNLVVRQPTNICHYKAMK